MADQSRPTDHKQYPAKFTKASPEYGQPIPTLEHTHPDWVKERYVDNQIPETLVDKGLNWGEVLSRTKLQNERNADLQDTHNFFNTEDPPHEHGTRAQPVQNYEQFETLYGAENT